MIHDNDQTITGGALAVDPSYIQYGAVNINNWLASLDGTGPKAHLVAITDPGYQDIMVVVPIPEPLTMAGLFLGISGLGSYIRKRRMA